MQRGGGASDDICWAGWIALSLITISSEHPRMELELVYCLIAKLKKSILRWATHIFLAPRLWYAQVWHWQDQDLLSKSASCNHVFAPIWCPPDEMYYDIYHVNPRGTSILLPTLHLFLPPVINKVSLFFMKLFIVILNKVGRVNGSCLQSSPYSSFQSSFSSPCVMI